ncbi:hypothetical protein [Larsenimonas suaedae]|uniref:Uncharacterized protein n=1 Tax=Larsenimonas suaedae TaxID=1851019 RepID=A0ABU1GVZ2_9GAMM|nr:hypothetical protein [Larsenimonas suaedae]MCM2973331.1 hypothetical protein [Larsenimonas suaedae]MDR5896224.1 hypothetical protein [Larsenimonas suaedae]
MDQSRGDVIGQWRAAAHRCSKRGLKVKGGAKPYPQKSTQLVVTVGRAMPVTLALAELLRAFLKLRSRQGRQASICIIFVPPLLDTLPQALNVLAGLIT